MPAADQLDADWQPLRASARRQCQTRHPELRPQRIKDRRPGRCELARSLPRSRQGQDRIKAAGPLACRNPRLLGGAAGIAESLQRELAAPLNLCLAQLCAEQRFVAVELGHVVAQTLEGADCRLTLVAF